ncbi:nuclear transport factor 2 family protein [Parafrankia sp. BMG5.11]|uniref:nuclear transport factor 2 family protein n=1 Tax=Parafrankia sp. BMG5.11 TaxID=222540 RepID=UPI00103CD07C|nr:nuclear transport factor 2 family protein [Parafrankia sp. BMG5.11]TCJ37021.1 nuclear transport factor 2 family protein [Parafrankia sp. BMG5.11]
MTVEERLQRLEDDRAIRDLKARYLRACDSKDPESVRDTLLPDAVIEFEGFPRFDNRDDFVAIYRQFGCAPGIYDIHHAANGVIAFDGPDAATGQWALTFHNVNLTERTLTQFGVEYEDVYVRKDGRWWIAVTRSRKKSVVIQSVDADGSTRVVAMGEIPVGAAAGQQ